MVSAEDEFFSIGAVLDSSGRRQFGFFRSSMKSPKSFEFLFEHQALDYYLIGHKYLALSGGNGYAILMSSTADLVEFTGLKSGPPVTLDLLPKKYRHVPELQPTSLGQEQGPFHEIEGSTIPVGLYAQDSFLYLLTREPNPHGGGTLWLIHQIDPWHRQLVGKMQIPTRANHLTIVNTDKDWYIFEKGAVEASGAQEIKSMLIIPNTLIRSRKLPSACK